MNLSGIIAISGRPGLFKVIVQGKNNVIVESLADRKRFPAYSSDRISALDDISIYTYDQEKPLKEIFKTIYEKEKGTETISHKEADVNLVNYLLEVLPNYDQERVYVSDIKKIYQWYNLLHKAGELKLIEKEEVVEITEETKIEAKQSKKTSTKKEDAADKKTVSVKSISKTPKAKVANSKRKEDKILEEKTMSAQNNI